MFTCAWAYWLICVLTAQGCHVSQEPWKIPWNHGSSWISLQGIPCIHKTKGQKIICRWVEFVVCMRYVVYWVWRLNLFLNKKKEQRSNRSWWQDGIKCRLHVSYRSKEREKQWLKGLWHWSSLGCSENGRDGVQMEADRFRSRTAYGFFCFSSYSFGRNLTAEETQSVSHHFNVSMCPSKLLSIQIPQMWYKALHWNEQGSWTGFMWNVLKLLNLSLPQKALSWGIW